MDATLWPCGSRPSMLANWKPGMHGFEDQRALMGLGGFKRFFKPANLPDSIQYDPNWSRLYPVCGFPAPV